MKTRMELEAQLLKARHKRTDALICVLDAETELTAIDDDIYLLEAEIKVLEVGGVYAAIAKLREELEDCSRAG